jgi:hypothetical protein
MRHTTLALALACSLFTAGSKKTDSGASASDKSAEAPAAAAGPVKTTATDLFADFTKPGGDAMALINKYHDGATFSGTVKTAPGDEAPTTMIIGAGDKKNIMAQFKPEAAAKIKTVKSGDSVTVTCKIDGATGGMMQASDCTLN